LPSVCQLQRCAGEYNKVLSFHIIPYDAKTQSKWIVVIRRESFTVSPHTRVYSRCFKKVDFYKPGRKCDTQGDKILEDHDYASAPDPVIVLLDENMSLIEEILRRSSLLHPSDPLLLFFRRHLFTLKLTKSVFVLQLLSTFFLIFHLSLHLSLQSASGMI
uniref:Uncharacterized protein n=1 Tax=Erpetoichthys calabaricus TaxID=27687 RepID=A0A8C4RUZ6_ERPCA